MPPTAIQLAKTADRLIILVDYAKLANSNYLLSATKTAPGVGSYIYNKIMQFKFNLTQVGMIGHSLGAHVAGHVGKASKGLLNEIIGNHLLQNRQSLNNLQNYKALISVGLDPAGPYFDTMGTGLYHTDAVHVLVLHTSRDFGTLLSRGDIDYYASKDRIVQPGCETAVYKPGCSHDKCLYIYNAALYPNNKIIAVKCSSQADTVQFGESSIKTGEYCFEAEACYKYNNWRVLVIRLQFKSKYKEDKNKIQKRHF